MHISALHSQFGEPLRRVVQKRRYKPNKWLQEFVSKTSFFIIGSISPTGAVMVSPRGGDPGFLKLLGDKIYFLEHVGNNLFESISNVESNPNIGLLLFIPGMLETVRIIATARVISPMDSAQYQELIDSFPASKEARDLLWVVHICEWYYHCGRALKRGRVFDETFIRERQASSLRLSSFVRKSDEF